MGYDEMNQEWHEIDQAEIRAQHRALMDELEREVRPMTPEEGRHAIEVMEQINRENAARRAAGKGQG